MIHLEVGASSPVAVGARLYRWRGERLLGVVVKASYTLQQRMEMAPIAPLDWRTRANVAHAGDEPFPLGVTEVIVGPLPQPARAAGNEIALTITRGPTIVLDVRRKAGDEGARDAAVGFGPVVATSPLRAPYSASMDLAAFRGVRELPLEVKFDTTFFQSAPSEQRVDELRGGDTIVLLGMSHIVKAMQTTLPHHKAHAVVQLGEAPPRRLPLRLDRLHIAPDAMVAELSFRGMVDVPPEAQVIRVLGGLETPTRPFAPLPFDAVRMWPVETIADGMPPPDEAAPPTQILAPTVPHGGTLIITPSFESTAVLSPDAKAPSSLPFRKSPGSAPQAAPAAPIPGAPWDDAPVSPAPRVIESDDDRPPETMLLAGPLSDEADLLDLSLDDAPGGASAATERQPAQASVEAPPPARVRREKVDPWRKDPEAAPAAPAAPPPPAPEASPTRPDISGGLYKKFKR
jgi:hypothetical protein